MAFVKALAKSELQPGQGKELELEGKKIALFNVAGKFLAVDAVCTHEDAPLCEGSAFAEGCQCVVECPWHGARFDLQSGAALTLPAEKPVKSYAVREVGDSIEVEL